MIHIFQFFIFFNPTVKSCERWPLRFIFFYPTVGCQSLNMLTMTAEYEDDLICVDTGIYESKYIYMYNFL